MQSSGITFDDDFFDNPYTIYEAFREHSPVFRDGGSGLWMAFSLSAVRKAAFDYQTFSSSRGNAIQDSPLRVGKTLGSMDPPRHDELRPVILRGFTAPRIAIAVDELMNDARARLRELEPGRRLDFVAEFSRPLLYAALGRMLGLQGSAALEASSILANLFHAGDGPLGAGLPPEDLPRLFEILKDQLHYRRKHPDDDLFSVMVETQASKTDLTDEIILGNMSTVLLAGNASIGHFFPNIIHALFLHPDQRRLIQNDLSLVPALLEETVRWDTSTQSFARQVMQQVELDGVTIPEGERIVLFYASANRDCGLAADAELFDVQRPKLQHFGFGAGVHHCLGAMSARRLLTPLLQELLPRLQDFHLDLQQSTRVRHVMVRGFKTLMMEIP